MAEDAQRWQRVEALFHEALAVESARRQEHLRAICGDDELLIADVSSLLRAADEEDAAAASPGSVPLGQPLPDGGWAYTTAAGEDPWIGRVLGQYRLESLLGRGGMGAVYLASRASDELRLRAAVKIVSARFTSDWLRQRFLLERQVLATLRHNHIARLIDGGFTEDGEPYLVMEYIEGRRLDTYCAEENCSVAEIVRLFLQLCGAVSYTHRNLIVHRDLKPGNVMVDTQGEIKLLDFGAAKLLDTRTTESAATRLGMRAFTPDYASPEQMFGNAVTAASDVYSLGVILYRLLTGHLPFDFQNKSSAELLRTVYDVDPLSPSGAVTRLVTGDTGSEEERRIRTSEIRGDLDAIVLKALRADPAVRYSSVDALISDLQAYLDHRPVGAREGSFRYVAAKFVRRHAVAVTAGFALLTVVGAGAAATIWQARVAVEEEAQARDGFERVRQLSKLLLLDFYDQVKGLPGSIDVQKDLVTQALLYLDKLAPEAAGDLALQLELIEAYTKLGNVQGNPYEQNLGDSSGALSSFEKALPLAEMVLASGSSDPASLRTVALLYQSKGEVLFSLGRPAESVVFAEKAAGLFSTLADVPGAAVEAIWDAASCLDSYGDQFGMRGLGSLGDLDAARAIYAKSMAYQQKALQLRPGNLRSLRGLAIGRMKTADLLRQADPGRAISGYREAIAAAAMLTPGDRQRVDIRRLEAMLHTKLGQVLSDLSQFEEGLENFSQAAAIHRALRAADAQDTRTLYDMASVAYHRSLTHQYAGRGAAAIASYRETAALLDELLQSSPANSVYQGHLAECLLRSGALLRESGDSRAGDAELKRGLDLAVEVAARPNASASDLNRAAHYLLQVEPTQWRDVPQALALARRAVAASHATTPDLLLTLARAQAAAGDRDDARATIVRALALFPKEGEATSRASVYTALNEELAALGQSIPDNARKSASAQSR